MTKIIAQLKKKRFALLRGFLISFIICLIGLQGFKAEASTIFYKNGFDYDADGFISSGEFISPDEGDRGFNPSFTNTDLGFTNGGFYTGEGYLIADDSTSTTPYNSARVWKYTDENNNLVYKFWGKTYPFDFVIFKDNKHESNYEVKIYPSFSFYIDRNYLPFNLPVNFSIYFLDDNDNVLRITRQFGYTQYYVLWGIRHIQTIYNLDVNFTSDIYDDFSTTSQVIFSPLATYDDIPEQLWLGSGRFEISFLPEQLKITRDDDYAGSDIYIDLPADFIKNIKQGYIVFEVNDYAAGKSLESFLRFDEIRLTSIDYIEYDADVEPEPTPTTTPPIPVPQPQEPNCQPPQGNFFNDFIGNVRYGVCLAMDFLFIPNDEQSNYITSKLEETKNLIASKPPFAYFYLIKNKLSSLNIATTTSEYFVDFNFYGVLSTIKTGLSYIIWFLGLLYILKRLRVI